MGRPKTDTTETSEPRATRFSRVPRPLRAPAPVISAIVLGAMLAACLLTLPYTLGQARVVVSTDETGYREVESKGPRFAYQDRAARQLAPSWAIGAGSIGPESGPRTPAQERLRAVAAARAAARLAPDQTPTEAQIREARPFYPMGTDLLGRGLMTRVLAGGGISLTVGLAAALISVLIGTLYGAIAAYAGGLVDAAMMRIVDILYGLPYILLVVLLAVAADAFAERWERGNIDHASGQRDAYVADALAELPEAQHDDAEQDLRVEALEKYGTGEFSQGRRQLINILTLLVAIGGVSWLTMARVIRGQVLSLKARPFMEAARAVGVPLRRQFLRHLLPNLIGPIVVYATLTVPQAILQESFLSFLGIGVKPPLPSWGNLAAEGLTELNTHHSHWWLLLFPCLLLAVTLLALNFLGEALREAFDPKRSRERG